MGESYSISLAVLIKFLGLTEVCMPGSADDILITRTEINRPGLVFTGYFGNYENDRIQIIGKTEYNYLKNLAPEIRRESLKQYFFSKPICTVFTNNMKVFPESIEFAELNEVPILSTCEITSAFMAALISKLNLELAPRMTRHGVFVEVYGEGILMMGDSGVGKSETAIELLKRGHRLIADDAVEIKKVSAITLIGTAPEIIRHYVELRGIGIVDVRRIFGMGAVKSTERVDLIINLEVWENGKAYDRFGLETTYMEIMGINIPSITIPVKPGRNLAVVIEIAAMNNRQKKMGYDTAVEFNKKLMGQFEGEDAR